MKTATKTSTGWNEVQLGSTFLCSEKNTFSQRETSALSQWEVILGYVLPTAVSLFSWGLWSPDRLILWSLMWT